MPRYPSAYVNHEINEKIYKELVKNKDITLENITNGRVIFRKQYADAGL